LNIYPNPSVGSINIDYNERFSTINIINLQGKTVLQSNQKSIDISGLENGIYIVQIATENGVLNSKFVKQ
ncbi:MAG: T9SS type A sorting domain-containing protein, partial [Bacteroidota bacterium]